MVKRNRNTSTGLRGLVLSLAVGLGCGATTPEPPAAGPGPLELAPFAAVGAAGVCPDGAALPPLPSPEPAAMCTADFEPGGIPATLAAN